MASVLSSHADVVAQGLGRAPIERPVPSSWPGTYIPNLSDWERGDIVLVAGAGFSGFAIRVFQSITKKPEMAAGAYWSHAAIYVGQGMVVDACYPGGVMLQPLWTYCENRSITVRRLNDPQIASPMRHSVAAAALSQVGQPYALLQAAQAGLGLPGARIPDPTALYCSTFVGLVVAQATGIRLWSDPNHQPLLPAILSTHPDLDEVQLAWKNT